MYDPEEDVLWAWYGAQVASATATVLQINDKIKTQRKLREGDTLRLIMISTATGPSVQIQVTTFFKL